MTVWEAEGHVAFLPENGALYFRAAQFDDDGEYACMVNEEKTPDSSIRLLIQGESNECLFLRISVENVDCVRSNKFYLRAALLIFS